MEPTVRPSHEYGPNRIARARPRSCRPSRIGL